GGVESLDELVSPVPIMRERKLIRFLIDQDRRGNERGSPRRASEQGANGRRKGESHQSKVYQRERCSCNTAWRNGERNRNPQTRSKASKTIFLFIFDLPTLRSAKTIGNSAILKPRRNARYLSSIWNE